MLLTVLFLSSFAAQLFSFNRTSLLSNQEAASSSPSNVLTPSEGVLLLSESALLLSEKALPLSDGSLTTPDRPLTTPEGSLTRSATGLTQVIDVSGTCEGVVVRNGRFLSPLEGVAVANLRPD